MIRQDASSALLAGIIVSTLAACQPMEKTSSTVDTGTVLLGESVKLTSFPIHLGDNSGKKGDVDRFKTAMPDTKFAGTSYSWNFDLSAQPTAGKLEVAVFSVAGPIEKDRYDCPTIVSLNGNHLYDMRRAKDAGSNVTSEAMIEVGGSLFKVGQNSLVVSEEVCRKTNGTYWNDSIVERVVLSVR